jgi:hypothetical protein
LSSSIGGLSSSVATTTSGLSSSIGSLSSSVATTTSGLSSSVGGLSSSVATTTSGLSSSVAITTSGLTSTITSLSSSVATTTLGLSSSIVSLSSSVATTTLGTKNRVDSIESKTGSYATTGSNIFQGNQTITGSLYVSQDLIIAGSSSIQHISSSIVNIADNIITVNASNPSLRFGGLAVIDSGSSPQVSGSILFDSVENQWIFIHQNQATVTSSMLIMGPETYDNVGNETHLTINRLVKSVNDEHIGDSNITDTGTKVSINSNTEVTGTLKVTGNITNPNITAIESATGSLNTFTSSLLTAIELTGSNLTVRGNFLVKGTTTNVNTTTLDVDNNLINLNGSGASFAGLRVKDTTAPNQISGSLLWDAANDYWIAGQLGSEQRLVRETEFNNAVTRIGNVETSTGSLNSFTSSINTTIKTKLNTEGVLSGSIQVNHNATTNYVANQHIDHTAVSITAGSGLTGGGDISTTRTINVGAGNGITVNADDIAIDTASATFTTGVKTKMNTDTVMSGSYLGTATTANLSENASYLYYTDARVKTKLNTEGVVSGSSQITFLGLSSIPSGLVSGSSQVLLGTTIHSGSFFNGIAVVSGSAQIDGSQLGSNKTITIGSTSTTLGGTSTSLAGLTSVTSTAFTGSLQGGISGNAATVTNGVYTTGDQTIGGIKTFSSAITASNYSGTHTGASSGTNTGDETLARVNALAITTVGTITSGIWNGTAIANANLANSSFNIGTTSISLGRASASQTLTGVSIDGNATSETLSTVTSRGATTTAAITISKEALAYGGTTQSFLIDGAAGNAALTLNAASAYAYLNFAQAGVSKFEVGAEGAATNKGSLYFNHNVQVGSAGAALYIKKSNGFIGILNIAPTTALDVTGAGTFSSTISASNFSGTHSGASSNTNTGDETLARVNALAITTVGTIGTGVWNGSSIATAYTAAKVTAVNAGTGVGVDTTTGSVTVSIGQAVTTSSNVTFARVTTPKIAFERNANTAHGISWYNISTYTAWCDYMANGGATSTGPTGNITASTGTYVTSWARRFFVEDASTYGWIFEKGAVAGTSPTVVAELRSSDGLFSTAGAIYSAGSLVKTSANSSYSTTFSSVSSVTVTHSLGTKDVAVFVYDSSDNMFWPSSIVTTSTSVVTVTFASSRSGRVVVVR